jgi:hypothetical protein
MGVASNTAINVMDGQGIPTTGQMALSFLTASALQMGGDYVHLRSQGINELSGVPEIAQHVDAQTHPNGPVYGPDGEYIDVPKPSGLLDQFGKPVAQATEYAGPREGMSEADIQAANAAKAEQDKRLEITAKQARLDDWAQTRRPGIFEVEPVENPPPLEKVKFPLLDPDGGLANLIKDNKGPSPEMPGDDPYGKPGGITTFLGGHMLGPGRTKTYVARLENDTGYPVYNDYDALDQANKKWGVANKALGKEAIKALAGSDQEDQQALYRALVSGDDSSLSPMMKGKLTALSNVTDKALTPYGISADEFWSEFVPAVTSDDLDTLSDPKFAKIAAPATDGRMGLMSMDLPNLMGQITSAGTFDSVVGPTKEALFNKYNAPTAPGDAPIPDSIKEVMNYSMSAMTGVPDKVTKVLGDALTDVFGKFGYKMDGEGIARRITSLQYAGLLAARVPPIIKQALHPIQTALGPMGGKWLAEGYRQIMTAAGKSMAEGSGVANGSLMDVMAELGPQNARGVLDRSIARAMWPFGKVVEFSRGAVYLGGRAKALSAAIQAQGDVGTFMRKSGAVSFNKQDASIVRNLYAGGNIDEAAHRVGQILVDDTQFMYDKMSRAKVTSGAMGTYLTAFGNYPLQYAGYLARLTERGGGATYFDVAKNISRFLAGNAAIATTFYGLGKLVSNPNSFRDAVGWSGVNVLNYTGAPIISTIASVPKAVSSVATKGPETKTGGINPDLFRSGKDVFTTLVPGGNALSDIVTAAREPSAPQVVGRYLGIIKGAPPKPKSTGAVKPLKAFKAF